MKITHLLGNEENRRIHFVKLTFIVESLLPIEAIEEQLEVSSSVSHQLYSLIHVKLGAVIESMENIKGETETFLKGFSLKTQKQLKKDLTQFADSFKQKWTDTIVRNLNEDVFGEHGLFKKCSIFDPFTKSTSNQSFEFNSLFFNVIMQNETTEKEFTEYLKMESPDNPHLNIINYWLDMQLCLPTLSRIALSYLSMSCGSLDVERSFSKMRDVQTIKRNKLSNTRLNMYSVLYFNDDIEGHFDLY